MVLKLKNHRKIIGPDGWSKNCIDCDGKKCLKNIAINHQPGLLCFVLTQVQSLSFRNSTNPNVSVAGGRKGNWGQLDGLSSVAKWGANRSKSSPKTIHHGTHQPILRAASRCYINTPASHSRNVSWALTQPGSKHRRSLRLLRTPVHSSDERRSDQISSSANTWLLLWSFDQTGSTSTREHKYAISRAGIYLVLSHLAAQGSLPARPPDHLTTGAAFPPASCYHLKRPDVTGGSPSQDTHLYGSWKLFCSIGHMLGCPVNRTFERANPTLLKKIFM